MASLYGNNQVRTLCKTLVQGGRFGHAYLFCGADGLGKKTFAKEFAKSILCRGEPKPCGVCTACRKVEAMTHPDVVLCEENLKSGYSVDYVRELCADCAILPNESDYKIYLIPHVEHMNANAFNAFLKTLEEPPRHTLFLLTAAHPEALAETVRSRVVPIWLSPLSKEELCALLAERFPEQPAEKRALAAELADGNGGEAIALLQNNEFEAEQARLLSFCEALGAGNDYQLLLLFSKFERSKAAVSDFLRQVIASLRLALRVRCGVSASQSRAVQALARLSERQMLALIACLEQSRELLQTNTNLQLTLSYFTAELCRLIHE